VATKVRTFEGTAPTIGLLAPLNKQEIPSFLID